MRYSMRLPHYVVISALLLGGMILPASAAEGGIRLNQTRVVMTENDKNVAVTLTNGGTLPYLVKASVAPTPTDSSVDAKTVPFVLTPPLFRLEANNRHTLLVVRQGQHDLPTDRESVFYLGFLAIPASQAPEAGEESNVAAKISVGIKSTIKLFYRPAGLALAATDAPPQLTARSVAHGMELTNPTPYYVTLSQLEVNGQPVILQYEDAMLSPFGSQHYAVSAGSLRSVKWKAINDYGGETEWHSEPVKGATP